MKQTYVIQLSQMHVYHARVGVYPHEYDAAHGLIVDACITYERDDLSDQLHTTLDYTAITSSITAMLSTQHHALLETACDRLLEMLTQLPYVVSARVTLHKPSASHVAQVAISASRSV